MGLLNKAKIQVQRVQELAKAPTSGFETNTDNLLQVLQKQKGGMRLKDLAAHMHVASEQLEAWLSTLEEQGLLKVQYPVNIFASPIVSLQAVLPCETQALRLQEAITTGGVRRLLGAYAFNADFVNAEVKIWNVNESPVPVYELCTAQVGKATNALLESMIVDLAKQVPLGSRDVSDPKRLQEQKNFFFKKAIEIVEKNLPAISIMDKRHLAGIMVHRVCGMGEMELLLSDNWLEEIAVNGSNVPVSVYHKRFGWLQTTLRLPSETDICNLASSIGRKVGREINVSSPIMDAHLLSGDRVTATLFPVSTNGNTITIRRFSRNPWTIVHMIDPKIKTMSIEMAAFLWLAIQYEINMIVAGGTASGKTSMLNSLCALIPPSQRILSIEDTRELSLPEDLHWNWVPLNTKNQNPEGEGRITMLDLLISSLRMRPDRLVVGEVRSEKQAEVMFEAMHTGQSGYATMHADTAVQLKRRLLESPFTIPATQVEALQLVLVQNRDRRTGIRRSLELAEVLRSGRENAIDLNYLFRWHPRGDGFEKMEESVRVVEDLNLHTGFTTQEIEEDLKQKQGILRWMYKQRIHDVDDIGRVMNVYYREPSVVVDAARLMRDAKFILRKADGKGDNEGNQKENHKKVRQTIGRDGKGLLVRARELRQEVRGVQR